MSLVITNISKVYGQGVQDYELWVTTTSGGKKILARFQHTFQDGLGECLRKAAIAADDPNRMEIQNEKAYRDALLADILHHNASSQGT